MKKEVDSILRDKQAGFRPGGSCCDQIFVLRSIFEECLEWNTLLIINFIDFQKAFDSIHRPTLWNILKEYGVPEKYVNIVKTLYENSKCAVKVNNSLTDWFLIKSGVRQGCILSPLLFGITIDWVMKRSMENKTTGIKWLNNTTLEDLDFADDIALLSHSYNDQQIKTTSLLDIAS